MVRGLGARRNPGRGDHSPQRRVRPYCPRAGCRQTVRGTRRRTRRRLACDLRRAHSRRDTEMGPGGQGGGHPYRVKCGSSAARESPRLVSGFPEVEFGRAEHRVPDIPELRVNRVVEQLVGGMPKIPDPGRTTRPGTVPDDTGDRCHVREAPSPERVLEIDQFLTQLVQLGFVLPVFVHVSPRIKHRKLLAIWLSIIAGYSILNTEHRQMLRDEVTHRIVNTWLMQRALQSLAIMVGRRIGKDIDFHLLIPAVDRLLEMDGSILQPQFKFENAILN